MSAARGRSERGGRRRPRHLDRRRRRRVQDARLLDGADGPQWKHLLASAVDGRRVSGDFATFRSERSRGASTLHHAQPCLRRRRGQPRRPPAHAARGALRRRSAADGRARGAAPRGRRRPRRAAREQRRARHPARRPVGRARAFEVSVPAGAVAGDVLHSTPPSGATVRFTVPPGAQPGHVLAFEVPPVWRSAARGARRRRRRRRRRHRRRCRAQSAGRGRAAARRGVERRRLGGGAVGGAAGGARSGGRATWWARCGGR